jgi:hypothetical protein
MPACMNPLFGGEVWHLCWELGQAKSLHKRAKENTKEQREHKSREYSYTKNQRPTSSIISHMLRCNLSRDGSNGVPSLKLLEVNMCNLHRWEHGSWDLSLQSGFQVLSPNSDMDACMHGPSFRRWGLILVLRIGSSKELTQKSKREHKSCEYSYTK